MRSPVLVTAPATSVVELAALKEHLRVDYDEDDNLITALGDAAVANLDGWRGIMGRGIMEQTWSQEYTGWGKLPLSLPDVKSVVVVGILDDVETAATTAEIIHEMGGEYVCADGGTADTVRVTYVVELPSQQLAAVQMAVKLLVGHWYENREASSEANYTEIPQAVTSLISPLRWVGV